MSYILDALRRSERERRQNEAIALGEFVPPPAGRAPYWRAGAAAAVVAVIGTAGAIYYWSGMSARGVSAAATELASSEIAPSAPMESAQAQPSMQAPPPPPALTPASSTTVMPVDGARDLAEEARTPKPKPATTTRPNPAVASVGATATAPDRGDGIKFLHAMPRDFQASLPALVVNIHVYSPVESERILYINNESYSAGQKIRDDMLVEEIVPDGVIVNRGGKRFKLPRPS